MSVLSNIFKDYQTPNDDVGWLIVSGCYGEVGNYRYDRGQNCRVNEILSEWRGILDEMTMYR